MTKTKFYTVDDLKNVLDTIPCSIQQGYISYDKQTLIELIRKDFDGEKLFLVKKDWNNEAPVIYGLKAAAPYSKEVEFFVKSQRQHGGGRNLIVMNESYFSNARYAIENRYWDLQQDTFKRDTRNEISSAISVPVKTKDKTKLYNTVEQLLNDFIEKSNKNITSLNDFLKSKYSQFSFYLNFYKASYVQQLIGNPVELLCLLDNQMDIMKNGFKPLSISYKKQQRFIDNIVKELSEEYYKDTDLIAIITDRIYFKESYQIKSLKKIYDEFGMIKTRIYQLEEEIKTETEERIRTADGIFPDSLIIQHAKDNGLISTSFHLSNK